MSNHDKDWADAAELPKGDVVAKLKLLDVAGGDFETQFAEFTQAVSDHAEAEEHEEFPTIIANRSPQTRHAGGRQFLAAFAESGGMS